MNKRIVQIGFLALATLGFVGCDGTDSDEFGEDIQPLDGPIDNEDPNVFRGRVIESSPREGGGDDELTGLVNALVWLDLNENGELDRFEGQLEPAALTKRADQEDDVQKDGVFELDVSALQRDRTEADLDPRDFPLMAAGLPGFTENARTGTVDKAFFMMAPPGIEFVTPFSTMAEVWRRLENDRRGDNEEETTVSEAGTEISARLSGSDPEQDRGAEQTIPVLSNFLLSGGERVPFYAQALRRLIQAQVPQELSDALANSVPVESAADLEGTAFTPDGLQVIGSILLDQGGELLADVDEAVTMNGGADGFELPDLERVADFDPDLSDPWLLRSQRLFLPPGNEDEFEDTQVPAEVRLAGIMTHDYSLGATLSRANVRGVPAPSMEPILRTANRGEDDSRGRVSEFGAQPGLNFDLDNTVEGSVSSGDEPDERFVFDWSPAGDLARLQSPRLGTLGLGDLADYTEGEGDRRYVATDTDAQSGRITAMDRVVANQNEVDYQIEESAFSDTIDRRIFSLFVPQNNDRTRQRSLGNFTTCDEAVDDNSFDAANERVINAKQEIEVKGAGGNNLGIETLYGHVRDDPGGAPKFRILVRDFDAAESSSLNDWRWEIEYFDDSGVKLSENQPDLIRSLRFFEGETFNDFCDRVDDQDVERDLGNDRLNAFIRFEYIKFTQFLGEIGAEL